MDTILKYVALLYLACCFTLAGCSKGLAARYEIIHIRGVIWASNVTSSSAYIGSSSESELDPEVILPVSDGDLLYMTNMDDQVFYYRYSRRDGKDLVVTFDTLNANTIRLNGQVKSLELSDDQASWELFEQLTDPQREQLSTLYIIDSLSDNRMTLLQQYESSLRGTGLVLEFGCDAKLLGELLSVCRPQWLISEGSPQLPDPENCMALSHLELLWIMELNHSGMELIPFCSNLESLIISDWDPLKHELLSLSKSRSLHTLTLSECGIRDFSNIEFPPSLLRLQLIDCDALSNLDGIMNLQGLKGISFTDCESVEGILKIRDLASLKWLAFPENVSQSEFESLLASLSSLEIVELFNCSGIETISPLTDLPDLNILIVELPKENLADLGALKELELLIISSSLFDEDPQWIQNIKTSLPNTMVVPGGGLCLGSGWILFLLPFLAISIYLFRSRRSFPSH